MATLQEVVLWLCSVASAAAAHRGEFAIGRKCRAQPRSMPHLVLLGDSVFDNARYVSKGHSVIEQLRNQLPAGWNATLLAVDGHVTSDIARQLERLPKDATHLLVSSGGNDALSHAC